MPRRTKWPSSRLKSASRRSSWSEAGHVVAALRAPGVYVERLDPPPSLDLVDVDVPAFLAVCERGPIDRPVRLTSWPAFEATFGSFVLNGIGAYAVKAFFDNGGRVAYVI